MNGINNYIDLHTHSTASDGSISPVKLMELAHECKLSYIALTDHDTMRGVPEAYKKACELGIKMIPGAEMSCVYAGNEIHILGYKLDFSGDENELLPIFSDLESFARDREERNLELLSRLRADGYDISYEDLNPNNEDTKITRAHFATALMNKGYVKDRSAAFDTLLADNSKYVPAKTTSIEKTCSFFNKHNLFFSLAHPLQYGLSNSELEDLILKLKLFGMEGLEVYHSTHKQHDSLKLKALASKYGLFCTGGSDFHGEVKPGLMLGSGYGSLNVPESLILDILKHKNII